MHDTPPRSYGKVLVCITEDWFALSHFQPLLRTLAADVCEVVVATNASGRMGEIEALGCRTVHFDYHRSSLQPLAQAGVVRRLARLIRAERPDVVHAIAIQTLLVTALATRLAPVPHLVLHVTGLGFVGISNSRAARVIRPLALRVLAGAAARPGNWLLAENPEDVAFLREGGVEPGARLTILGGAGIDEGEFPAQPPPANPVPVAAFVGRLIRPKGVHVLVEAQRLLTARGVPLALALYGDSDEGNTEGVPLAEIEGWVKGGGIVWHGRVPAAEIRNVWARSDIAVLPAISREGMPRAVLEAAASARPLVVTDVPGCRHFVRDGIEGLIAPPSDATALAASLEKLALDPALRARMGAAARARLLSGYTIAHVTDAIRRTYRHMLGAAGTDGELA